jgi:hypothetical protein
MEFSAGINTHGLSVPWREHAAESDRLPLCRGDVLLFRLICKAIHVADEHRAER